MEQISMFIDYEDIDDEDIEDLVDKIKDFYETASNSLVNVHGNLSVLDGIKKDAKTRDVAKRKDNIFVDNGGDLSARYEESRSKIEEDCKLVADWKVM